MRKLLLMQRKKVIIYPLHLPLGSNNVILFIYFLLIATFALYSYSLLDPNITLINHNIWESFRNIMVNFGYYHRQESFLVFIILSIGLILLHIKITQHKKINPIHIALISSCVLLFSYPFLSHDLFNYMFDARIVTLYGKSPYLFKALDFPHDEWLRFMHWTHRTYPYGPAFLPITIIVSFFSFSKLILNLLLFKFLFIIFYFASVYVLKQKNTTWALFFASHPLIIIEGLVNNHNDFIALSLGIIGIYFLGKKKKLYGRIFTLLSGGIKYITLPLIFLYNLDSKEKSRYRVIVIFLSTLALIGYISFSSTPQPWYFLNLLVFLPLLPHIIKRTSIITFALLLSYYPYIALGGWDTKEKVMMKTVIIYSGVIINIMVLMFLKSLLSKKGEIKKYSERIYLRMK